MGNRHGDEKPYCCAQGCARSRTLFAAPAPAIGNLGFISPAMGEPAALTKRQSDALNTYNHSRSQFEQILAQRRAQIDSKQPLPNLPGQALYLARNNMMSAYKDLTDALPSRIGGPNKFGIPPAYFDADNEPLLDEYRRLFDLMQAPPANAQKSDTPFKDVVDLGTAIARARGLDAANAEAAGRISLGLFFAETNGNQNIGNARSNKYKGSLQTGVPEDQNGRRKWAAIKNVDRSLRSRAERPRRQGGGAGRQSRPSLQPLDRRAGRPDERARGYFPANAGDRENAAGSDRSDEAVRADPDHSEPDQIRARLGQPRRLQNFRPEDHGAICATTASSPLGRPTGPKHLRPSAKSSMRCGCSTKSSSARLPNSTRSRSHQKVEARTWRLAIRADRVWPIAARKIPSRPP